MIDLPIVNENHEDVITKPNCPIVWVTECGKEVCGEEKCEQNRLDLDDPILYGVMFVNWEQYESHCYVCGERFALEEVK